MTSNFIHRILKSLRGSVNPSSAIEPLIVDNTPTALDEGLRERRLDARFAVRTPCLYELDREQRRATPTISGKAHSLNVSSGGVLLLLDQQPQTGQVLSLHNPALNPALKSQQGISLFEVRWTASLSPGSQQGCCLVGCHLAFGRFPFFLLQRQYLHRDISSLSI